MESPRLSSVPGEGRRTGGVNAVDPVVQLHLTGSLEQVGVAECCRETEDEVAFWMLRDWLEDGSVHDDQMFRSRLHWSALFEENINYSSFRENTGKFLFLLLREIKTDITYFSGVAGIKQESCSLQTNPVTFPSSLSRQLHLMFLSQKPFLDAEKASFSNSTRAVKWSTRSTLFGFIGRVVDTLAIVVLGHCGSQRHPVVVRDLNRSGCSLESGVLSWRGDS